MKKIYWVGMIILMILIVAGYLFYIDANPLVVKTNNNLVEEYPYLENYSYMKYGVEGINDEKLSYNEKTKSYVCETRVLAEKKKYSSTYFRGGEGYSEIYVIDCGQSYWIYRIGDAGPYLYGEFEK